MSEEEKKEAKDVEFYAATVNAWFNTKFERDKSLLTLSSGAIGLLITLISTIGVKSVESLILYVFALICFIVCLASLLWIFSRNAKHLEDVVRERALNDPLLKVLDHTAVLTFMLGVVFTSVIAVSTAINKYTEKEIIVAKQEDKTVAKQEDKTTPQICIESFNLITNMRVTPSPKAQSSVNGIVNMQPITQQNSEQSTTAESKTP
ncbi:MAG: hypothetical protein RL344_1088 [Pseudomonadota bacterium]|jgi:uncharacterized membrane protein YbaN (DUF454 family)